MSGTSGNKGYTFRKATIAFDFDGVLHASRGWLPVMTEVDTAPLRQALNKGFSVAVMTCNDVHNVAAELRLHGMDAMPDPQMRYESWYGGKSGRQVLVTNRKIAARYYIDDRAVHWTFWDKSEDLWNEINYQEGLRHERSNFQACPSGRHYGANGGAGVLPWTIADGIPYVLLGLRARTVQQGETWSVFGGACNPGETPRVTAAREMSEEISGLLWEEGTTTAEQAYSCPDCGWSYTTYAIFWDLSSVPAMMQLTWEQRAETTEIRWVPVDEVRELPLHTGFAATWPSLQARVNEAAASQAA